jgi:hypothetical protein
MPDDENHDPYSPGSPIPGVKSQPGAGAIARRKAFVKLANDRMTRAIDAISLIGNLSNKKNYRYGTSDVDKMETALLKAVEQAILHFRSPRAGVPSFQLSDEDGEEC